MGSFSNVSTWSVGIPSVPLAAAYAAPAWSLFALDAFHPVADDTPSVLNDTLPVLTNTLFGVTPVLDDTARPAAGALPPVDPILDDHLHGVEPFVP